MTVKYHIDTPFGIVTRTSRGRTAPQYTHIVVYEGHVGVPGGKGNYAEGKKIPTFHHTAEYAVDAAIVFEGAGGKAMVWPIKKSDYTIT